MTAIAEAPSHHVTGGGYTNPWPTWNQASGSMFFKWMWERNKLGLPTSGWLEASGKRQPTPAEYQAAFPSHAVDYQALQNPPADAIQALWIGHASMLVQMNGVTFLTDPVLSERCSAVQWAGPKRLVPAALDLEHADLPVIDFVAISHNHYDHLDSGTVKRLHARFGDTLAWYVPLGLEAWFKGCGISNVKEMDWWDEVTHLESGVRLAFTPAQHWSARGIFDRRATLWGSWVVKGPDLSFWFAGDSGYCPVFTEIGERHGPFDLAAIPIGAYEPRWFMGSQHINPAEAVQIHQDVRAKKSVGIHCATFCLTDEAMDEPPKLLVKEVAAAKLPSAQFVMLQHGTILRTAGGVDTNSPPLLPVQ